MGVGGRRAGQVVDQTARGLGTPYPIGRAAKPGGCNRVSAITYATRSVGAEIRSVKSQLLSLPDSRLDGVRWQVWHVRSML